MNRRGEITSYNYWDAVAIHSTNVGYTTSGVGADLTGTGTLANPWRQEVFAEDPPSSNAATTTG